MALIDILIENESNATFMKLVKVGLIPISVLDRKVYYLFYLEQRKEFSKMQSVQNTCDEFSISQATVYNSIQLMLS